MIIIFHPSDVLQFHSSKKVRNGFSEILSKDENVDIVVQVSEELFKDLQGGDQEELSLTRNKLTAALLKLNMKRLQRNEVFLKPKDSEQKLKNLASEKAKVTTPMPNYRKQLLHTAFGDNFDNRKGEFLITQRTQISTSKQVRKMHKEVTAIDAKKLSTQTTKRTLSSTRPTMQTKTPQLRSEESKVISTRPDIRSKKPTPFSSTPDLRSKEREPIKLNASNDATNLQTSEPKPACIIPKLNPFDKTAMKYIGDIDELVCKGVDHAQLKDGVLKVKASNVRDALIRYVRRKEKDDFQLDFSEPMKLARNGNEPVNVKEG